MITLTWNVFVMSAMLVLFGALCAATDEFTLPGLPGFWPDHPLPVH